MATSTVERLARVEEQVNELKDKVDKLEKTLDKLDEKIDALLQLRYKGAGAFWLASALMGAGIVGFITKIFHLWSR